MGSSNTAKLNALKAQFGTTRVSLFPATFYFALLKDGVEPDSTGNYARVAKANDGTLWNDPTLNGGTGMYEVTTKVDITYPAATDLYQLSGLNGWAIYDNSAGGTLWYSGSFSVPVTISGAGDQIRIPSGSLKISQG